MGAEDHGCAFVQQVLDGGQSTADTGVITDFTVFDRNIEIDTDKDFLPVDIDITNGFFIEHS